MNTIIFDKIIGKAGSSGAIETSKILEYVMDQGIQYEVIRLREQELKAKLPTAKISDDTTLDEQYVGLFKQLYFEQQFKLRNTLLKVYYSLDQNEAK